RRHVLRLCRRIELPGDLDRGGRVLDREEMTLGDRAREADQFLLAGLQRLALREDARIRQVTKLLAHRQNTRLETEHAELGECRVVEYEAVNDLLTDRGQRLR